MSSRRKSATPRRNRRKSAGGSSSAEVAAASATTSTTVTQEEVVEMEPDSDMRLKRVEEKHQLHTLNDRLQNFVLHSKAMEMENADLKDQIRRLKEAMKDQLADVHREYQAESKKLRTSVSTVTAKNGGLESENARLNAQVHAMQSKLTESDTLRQRTHKLEDRVRDLEELVNQLTAKDKQNQEEIERLREIIANHEEVIATREEELQVATKELETVEKTIKKDREADKADLADKVREKLTEAHKKWQAETEEALRKLENDLRTHFKRTVQELHQQCDVLADQNDRLRKDNDRLNRDVDDARDDADRARRDADAKNKENKAIIARLQKDLTKREEELTDATRNLFDKDKEFNDLMDVKISLQAEIDKYRSILDVEEARIATPERKKRPRPVEDEVEKTSTKRTRNAKRARKEKPKKKKGKKKKPADVPTRIVGGRHSGPVRINSVDLVSDCVSVMNQTATPINMTGWKLISETGNQEFSFPEGLNIEPGKRVTIWSGRHAESHHAPPDNLFWTRRFVWNNQGDTAILVNPDGEHVSTVTGVPAALSATSSEAPPRSAITRGSSPSSYAGAGAGAGAGPGANGDESCRVM